MTTVITLPVPTAVSIGSTFVFPKTISVEIPPPIQVYIGNEIRTYYWQETENGYMVMMEKAPT